MPALHATTLERRQDRCYSDGYGNIRCYSAWSEWVRWLVLVLIILGFVLLFFLFSCLSARRRRRRGLAPYRGTGWLAGRHGVPTYNPNPTASDTTASAAPYYANTAPWQPPAPPYSPPPATNNGNSYGNFYAGPQPQTPQQTGIELQSNLPQQPPAAYGAPRVGEPIYQPPVGPPPGKN